MALPRAHAALLLALALLVPPLPRGAAAQSLYPTLPKLTGQEYFRLFYPKAAGDFFGTTSQLALPDLSTAVLPNALQNIQVGQYITPEMCGAVGDGSADDTAALNAMFTVVGGGTSAACPNFAANGSWSVKLLHKTYKVTSDIIVDIGGFSNNLKSDGLKIIAPDGGADIDGRTITTTPTFEIRCTGQTCNNLLFGVGGRITVKGSNVGPVFVMGKTDLLDVFTGADVNYLIPQNSSTDVAAAGAQINHVGGGSKLRIWGAFEASTGGASGYGIELTDVSASDLDLNSNWAAGSKQVYLTNGTVQGNRIHLSFGSGGGTGLTIDTANANNNSIFPNFTGTTTAVNATAGSGNVLEVPYFGAAAHFAAQTGIVERDATTNPYQSSAPTTGSTVTLTDPPITAISTYLLVHAAPIASLTVSLPRCDSTTNQYISGFGTQKAITALTVNAQTAGIAVGQPAALGNGQAVLFQCRGGEGVWRPIANTPSYASAQSQPGNPTGTTSTTPVMMGLSGALTPTAAGKIVLTISGDIFNATIGDGAKVQASYGTGTAPANAAALTGTQCGSQPNFIASTAAGKVPFSVQCIVTGLLPGTAYWLDVSLAAITGGTATIENLSLSANEFN